MIGGIITFLLLCLPWAPLAWWMDYRYAKRERKWLESMPPSFVVWYRHRQREAAARRYYEGRREDGW